jgi:hypothetical protein
VKKVLTWLPPVCVGEVERERERRDMSV